MVRFARYAVRNHPALLFACLTIGMFFLAGALPHTGIRAALMALVRVLIIPFYAGYLAALLTVRALGYSIASGNLLARTVALGQVLAGFAPYLVADVLWRRYRRSRPADV